MFRGLAKTIARAPAGGMNSIFYNILFASKINILFVLFLVRTFTKSPAQQSGSITQVIGAVVDVKVCIFDSQSHFMSTIRVQKFRIY